MCGIVGYLSNIKNAQAQILEALKRLQNRGYDSAGFCVANGNQFYMSKALSDNNVNAIDKLTDCQLNHSNSGIGHTRWATHGVNSLANTHPHYNNDQTIAIVHNGIIENYLEIKQKLQLYGTSFYGQSDSEVIAKYIEYLTDDRDKTIDFEMALSRLELSGSWAILAMSTNEPQRIYYMKHASPLIIGINNHESMVMFVSELAGFDANIQKYFVIQDGDYGYVELSDGKINVKSQFDYEYLSVPQALSTPAPSGSIFTHHTFREICEQPDSITRLINSRIDTLNNNLMFPELSKISITTIDHIIFLACGTSYHAAQIGARYFKKYINTITFEVIDGADFELDDIPKNRTSLVILLSQSGETRDLYRALQLAKHQNIPSIGIVNVENSLIAREVSVCLYTKAGSEKAVASTKSFTNQVLMLLLLSLYFSQHNNIALISNAIPTTNDVSIWISKILELPKIFEKIIQYSINEIQKIVPYFDSKSDCFILGKHIGEWMAREASLKIKEISYLHSEAFAAAALKHGPFALLEPDIPVIVFAINDEYFTKLTNVVSEIKSRLAKVICITNNATYRENIDNVIYMDVDNYIFPFVSIIPTQLLAYYLALQRGYNPDYPRNLAKVVTVE